MPPKTKTQPKAGAAATRAINDFEARFAKTFGEGTLEISEEVVPYEVISTGSLSLDYALVVGGLVEGRLTEIWGAEGVGKSTLALKHLAEAQKKHPSKRVAFIDVEQKMDRKWATVHGVDLSRLYLFRPNNAEDVADALKDLIRSGLISAVVVDSIGAMIPEAEKEKDADQAVMAQQAKIVTRMVKIAAVEARKAGVSVVLINQQRANLGYGSPTTTGGGFALKHVTTMKLRMKRTGTPPFKVRIDGEDVIVGHEVSVYVERNGVAAGYRSATMNLFHEASQKYGPVGIDKADETVVLGIKSKVITQRGAWYDTPDGQSFQGREALIGAVRGDLTLQDEIRSKVLATVADQKFAEEVPAEDDVAEEQGPKFRTAKSIAEEG